MKALLLVDIQNDFLPAGALPVPAGDEVVAVANRMAPGFDLVVATQDWHPADHASFASQHAGKQVFDVIEHQGLQQILWPDHCVQQTAGAGFASGLDVAAINHVIRKGTDRDIDSYSAFFDNGHRKSTGLADYLNQQGVDEIVVIGLALDVCVKFTVLDALKEGFKVTAALEGCRGVDLKPGDCDAANEAMRSAGAVIVDRY